MKILRVASTRGDRRRGLVAAGGLVVPAALGRGGIRARKREGDGITPAGVMRLVAVLYRADRVQRPQTKLPLRAIRPDDGWCDDPRHRRYNRPVRLPFGASHERLWRDDHLYDLVVVLDYNLDRPVRGRGSAIFLHLASPGLAPTAGCVAITAAAMGRLLRCAGPETRLVTQPGTVGRRRSHSRP